MDGTNVITSHSLHTTPIEQKPTIYTFNGTTLTPVVELHTLEPFVSAPFDCGVSIQGNYAMVYNATNAHIYKYTDSSWSYSSSVTNSVSGTPSSFVGAISEDH